MTEHRPELFDFDEDVYVELTEDTDAVDSERYRATFVADNNLPLFRSTEGYSNVEDVLHAVELVAHRAPTFVESKSADVDHGKIRVIDLRGGE